jgi:4'-phosphopantetheinyl transferase
VSAYGARDASGEISREAATVRVYYARIAEIPEAAIAALPGADRERVADARAERRAQHLGGRALLRAALVDATGRSLEVRTAPGGRLECGEGVSVSVSHSAEWAVCAVGGRGAVGVDVEQPRENRQLAEIARGRFAREESDWVAARPSPRFYLLWVLKEAYLKALGLGIAGGLDALQCRIEGAAIHVLSARHSQPPALRVYTLGSAFVGVSWLDDTAGEIAAKRFSATGSWRASELELVAATRH